MIFCMVVVVVPSSSVRFFFPPCLPSPVLLPPFFPADRQEGRNEGRKKGDRRSFAPFHPPPLPLSPIGAGGGISPSRLCRSAVHCSHHQGEKLSQITSLPVFSFPSFTPVALRTDGRTDDDPRQGTPPSLQPLLWCRFLPPHPPPPPVAPATATMRRGHTAASIFRKGDRTNDR